MDALPALTTLVTEIIGRQFAAAPEDARPEPVRKPMWRRRARLSAALARAADAVAPRGFTPRPRLP